jgi:Na+/proline symporter
MSIHITYCAGNQCYAIIIVCIIVCIISIVVFAGVFVGAQSTSPANVNDELDLLFGAGYTVRKWIAYFIAAAAAIAAVSAIFVATVANNRRRENAKLRATPPV